jgi:hypothetical protein
MTNPTRLEERITAAIGAMERRDPELAGELEEIRRSPRTRTAVERVAPQLEARARILAEAPPSNSMTRRCSWRCRSRGASVLSKRFPTFVWSSTARIIVE